MPAVLLPFVGLLGSPYMMHSATLICVGLSLDFLFPCGRQSTLFASLSLPSALLAPGCGVPSSQVHVLSRFMPCGPVGCAVLLALCGQPESGCPVTQDTLAHLYVPDGILYCHQCCAWGLTSVPALSPVLF